MTTNIPINGPTVRFVHQESDDACGAACAVMVLAAMNVNHPGQRTIFNQIQNFKTKDRGRNKENWATSPDGLQDVLNNFSKPNHFFELYARRSQGVISRRMVWTIFNYKTPCIALISSGIHWVVVYNFQLGGSDPTSYAGFSLDDLQGFFIRDPFEDVPTETMVDYNEWIDFKQTPETTGLWDDKYVALCDPDPPEDKKGKNMDSNIKKPFDKKPQGSFNEANSANSAKPDKPANKDELKKDKPKESKPKNIKPLKFQSGEPPITRINKPGLRRGLIDDNTARSYSMWHLKHGGFYVSTKFSRMMINPGPGMPMLVRGLDTEDFWYIVPFLEAGKKIGGVMRLNARDTKFQEAAFSMEANKPLKISPLTNQRITNILIDKFGKPNGKIVIEDILVWKPCAQSYSRFRPFYKVKWGTKTRYVRIDGEAFFGLTKRRHG